MRQVLGIVVVNVFISAALYFGVASLEKFVLPMYFTGLKFSNWHVPASWASWTPSVVIPTFVTAFRISPKLGLASLVGIVAMWGGFMITDFQQPPFIGMLRQLLASIH